MTPATPVAPPVAPTVKIIVADTGPLIALAKLEQLSLLTALFAEVHIPKTVLAEATAKRGYADAEAIHAFAMAHARLGETIDSPLTTRLLSLLDNGEAQALVLAKQLDCAVLMDEKRGRQVALEGHFRPLPTRAWVTPLVLHRRLIEAGRRSTGSTGWPGRNHHQSRAF